MRKPNTECRVCGKEYYACMNSKQFGGYKMVACSEECYQKYMVQVMVESNMSLDDLSPELKEYAKEYINSKTTTEDKKETEENIVSTIVTDKGEVEMGVVDTEKSQESPKKAKKSIFPKLNKK